MPEKGSKERESGSYVVNPTAGNKILGQVLNSYLAIKLRKSWGQHVSISPQSFLRTAPFSQLSPSSRGECEHSCLTEECCSFPHTSNTPVLVLLSPSREHPPAASQLGGVMAGQALCSDDTQVALRSLVPNKKWRL